MNLIMRLLIAPVIIFAADILSPQINFANIWQIIIIGWILAVIGEIVDSIFFGKVSILTLTWTDTILAVLLVWISGLFFKNSYILFSGALYTSILLGFAEYIDHRHIATLRKREIL